VPEVASILSGSPYFSSSYSAGDPYNVYWQQDDTEFLTRELTPDGLYRLHNARPRTAETSIFQSDETYNGVSLEMVARLESSSQPDSAYGIVFRYHGENNFNVFAVDGTGRFSIWVRLNGEWIELRGQTENWTPDPAIQPIGKSNILSVTLLNDTLIGYVNNRQVVHVTDDSLENGRIGIYFATDDGEATVSVDSYRVFSTIPSMTGGP
jgi:hypothetical protein